MKARAFAYARPRTLEAAHAAFADAEGDASYISGGQSLVPALAMRLQAPACLVDLGGIDALKGIAFDDGVLRIGALTRHAQALSDPLIARHAPLLTAAAPFVAHPAIRNRGTLGGSVALADPASEFPAMMLTMDATMEIFGTDGLRDVPAADYFQDLYQTAIEPGEILVALKIPGAAPGTRIAFEELARRRGDYAMVGSGIMAQVDDGAVAQIAIGFFSVGATPVRARAVEALLTGRALDAAAITEAQAALDDDLDPPDDTQVPAAMRRHLARVVLGRLLTRIAGTPGEAP